MLTIGITGGMGSGKSTVCSIFKILGVPVFNADVESKNILTSCVEVRTAVKNLLGEESYSFDNVPDRIYIANKVFSNSQLLKALNEILHPAVFSSFDSWREKLKNHFYVIKEAAILFESGSNAKTDFVIVVTAPKEIRIRRIKNRDHIAEENILERMSQQFDEGKLIKLSDWEIKNDDHHLIIPQILDLHHLILDKKS